MSAVLATSVVVVALRAGFDAPSVTAAPSLPTDATAASINFTAARVQENGHLTVYECGTTRPTASTLNYTPGTNIANSAIVPLSIDGKVCIYTHGTTDIIADITGWFPDGSNYQDRTPHRLLDTRETTTPTAGSTVQLQVTGRAGVPPGAPAASINFTAARVRDYGHLTAYECGTTRPTASTLNYTPGTNIANSAIVPLSSDGKVCIYTHGTTDIIADITGWFVDGSNYRDRAPRRLLDTRETTTPTAGSTVQLQVTGRAGVKAGATAASINFTAARVREHGHLTAYECGKKRPTASTLNYTPGTNIANSTIVPLSSDGKVCIYTHGTTDIIADITGWFPDSSNYQDRTPHRLLDTRETTTPTAGSTIELQVNGPEAGTVTVTPGPDDGNNGGTDDGNDGGTDDGESGAQPPPPRPTLPRDFEESFDGNEGVARFDRGVYHRDTILVSTTIWQGDHDLACNGADTYRPIHRDIPDQSFYACKGHLMSSVGDTSGYSIGWFSPKQTFTRADHRTVTWDVNITDLGKRQWWEVSVLPLDAPHLATVNFVAQVAHLDVHDPGAVVLGNGPVGGDMTIVTEGTRYTPMGTSLCGASAPDPAACDSKEALRRFSVTDNLDGTITFEFLGETYTYPGRFPKEFRVYFKDHNFTPDKDGVPAGHSWHWDNITVS